MIEIVVFCWVGAAGISKTGLKKLVGNAQDVFKIFQHAFAKLPIEHGGGF